MEEGQDRLLLFWIKNHKGIAAHPGGFGSRGKENKRMRMIVEVPDEKYRHIKEMNEVSNMYQEEDCFWAERMIANGKPLPEEFRREEYGQ